jgi:hypothetical protein
LDTLLVKRKGVVVASISAVSNAYSVAATGTDGVEDVSVTYYDPPDGSATAPDTVTRTIKRPDGLIDFIRYDSKGEIEKKVSFDPNAPPTKSQQGASQGPSSTGAPQRRIIREK